MIGTILILAASITCGILMWPVKARCYYCREVIGDYHLIYPVFSKRCHYECFKKANPVPPLPSDEVEY